MIDAEEENRGSKKTFIPRENAQDARNIEEADKLNEDGVSSRQSLPLWKITLRLSLLSPRKAQIKTNKRLSRKIF